MGRRIFVGALFAAFCFFTACDDSSSGAGPDPVAEISSSSDDDAISSSERASFGGSSFFSSDSKGASSVSSSSEQMNSSSVSGKNSSSSVPNPVSSSEESFSGTPCEKDEEGYTVFISQEQVKYICQNGFWIPMSSSSVVQQSSSSKYYDMSRQFNAKLSYGEFTDPRDNHVYKTIRLYDDVTDTLTFFAENLNFGKMIAGGEQQGDSTKYCYDDDPWYCENGWGGLYTWATAMAFPAVCDSSQMGNDKCPNTTDGSRNTLVPNNSEYIVHQGICPDGWHIMNQGEWVAAINGHGAMSGSQYLSSEVWNGTMENPRGFSLLPVGLYDFVNGRFNGVMELGYYWIPREYSDEPAFIGTAVNFIHNQMSWSAGSKKRNALSIRCVKDY